MRKENTIVIQDRGRPLSFRIREMAATQLESWIIRSLLLLTKADAKVPASGDMLEAGRYLYGQGLRALSGVAYEEAKPLLDEMLACCTRITESGVEQICTPETVDGFIEDVSTLFKLRMEVLKLNLGFFSPERVSDSGSPKKVRLGKPAKAST